MASNLKFGKCLKQLLTASGTSINKLSKAINVDSSLVNRWVNEKRIPPYNTNYIDNISEHLSKNFKNSYQIQHLNELYETMCKGSEMNVCIRSKIKKILYEAQGYSIELKRMEKKERKALKINKNEISDIFSSFQPDYEFKVSEYISPAALSSLSSEDKIVSGSKSVMSAALSLLNIASKKNPNGNSTIHISFINDFAIMEMTHDTLVYYRDALLGAIDNGWNILCLLRLNSDINRTARFIKLALPLMKTGKFDLYYFIGYDYFSAAGEILTIPEIGTLFGLATKANSGINHAILFKTIAAANIFCSHFNMLLTTIARPLMGYYKTDNPFEYDCFLIENEEKMGNRFIYKYNLCISMLPVKLYEKLLKRKNLSYNKMLKGIEYYKKQANAFLSNINYYEYKDIYCIDSVLNLIKCRKLCFYCNGEVEIMNLGLQDIIEILNNIIYLLVTYENYNVAFMPKKLDNTGKYSDYSFIFKERHALLLEAYIPSKNTPEVQLSIEEPLMIKAFDEFFKEAWNQIAPENKDKKDIIKWIQSHINLLKDCT